jgi:hypothetical protein
MDSAISCGEGAHAGAESTSSSPPGLAQAAAISPPPAVHEKSMGSPPENCESAPSIGSEVSGEGWIRKEKSERRLDLRGSRSNFAPSASSAAPRMQFEQDCYDW